MGGFVRTVVVLGSLSASATMYILVNPVYRPFIKFNLTDKVSELPNGSLLDVVHPAGYASFAAFGATCTFLTLYRAWCSCAARRPGATTLVEKSRLDAEKPV